MGKQVNLKNEKTVELAREIAGKKGKSIAATIHELLEQERARMADERARRIAEVMEIAAIFREKMPPEWKAKTSKEIMDELYDEDGLPI
jgi:antitoxin VapB